MTTAQAIDTAASTLLEAGVEQPRREAMALVAWVSGASTAAILTHPERELGAGDEALLRQAVGRRAAREPLAYIIGRAEFFGLELELDARVLVPRPETEHVVEQVLAMAREFDRPLIADVGSGSGCIAVAVAHSLPPALVYAIDSSADALEVAAANVRRHHLQRRVLLLQGNLLAPLPERVHVIASNPPYIATPEFAALMPEVREHEPRAALDGGEDGLAVIRRLIQQAPGHLLSRGALVMEIGARQGAAALELARQSFERARIERDLVGLDRVLVARL